MRINKKIVDNIFLKEKREGRASDLSESAEPVALGDMNQNCFLLGKAIMWY